MLLDVEHLVLHESWRHSADSQDSDLLLGTVDDNLVLNTFSYTLCAVLSVM